MNCLLNNKIVRQLVKEYGSPLYVFHEKVFVKNYNNLINAFRTIYPKYNIGYSYKTNYTPYICKLVKSLGGLAEVVSEMEYELAKRIGYKNNEIIYNGPVKGAGLFEHLNNGGIANIDSLDELNLVLKEASAHPDKIYRIAFRANIDIEQGFISRFGLDAYEDDRDCELKQAFTLSKQPPNVQIAGLHCHIGKSRGLDAWKNRIRIMFSLVDRYFDGVPEFIDFGSGMHSVMEPELAKQFNDKVPTFEEYASLLAGAMKDKYGHLPYDKQPWLYTEPGTTVVSGCVSFLSTVLTIKNVKSQQYVTFDCSGGNMGDICHLKNLPISIFDNGGNKVECKKAIFVGYTCLEHDHIYDGFNGNLAVGDIVQFRNIGSYSNVFKPPFILPNCAMVALKVNSLKLIKRKEVIDDVFSTYVF